jgi:DNA repair exonuclease SbcCD nuclease subunit
MSKVIFLADVHLGVGTRLHDIIWALQVVRDYSTHHGIDTCVVLGDLFHDREQIGIDVLCEAHAFLKSAKTLGQKWIAFPGNHDMYLKRSWEYSSIAPMAEVLTIIRDVKLLMLDGKRFWILPFIYSENAYMRVVKRIQDQYQEGDVLLTHIGVRKAYKNICFLLQDWSIVDFSKTKFDQVFAGHFHTYQKVNDNLWYIGSIIPYKIDEGDVDHGFTVYDLEAREHEFVSIWDAGKEVDAPGTPPPQYHTFYDELLDEKTPEDVDNCIIRVAMTREYSQSEKDTIRERLVGMGAREVRFFDISDEAKDRDPDDKPKHYTIPASRLFLKWIKEDKKNNSGLTSSLLKRLNRDVMSEGDEIYQKMRMEE